MKFQQLKTNKRAALLILNWFVLFIALGITGDFIFHKTPIAELMQKACVLMGIAIIASVMALLMVKDKWFDFKEMPKKKSTALAVFGFIVFMGMNKAIVNTFSPYHPIADNILSMLAGIVAGAIAYVIVYFVVRD